MHSEINGIPIQSMPPQTGSLLAAARQGEHRYQQLLVRGDPVAVGELLYGLRWCSTLDKSVQSGRTECR